jgi:hypothetical protein
MEIPCDIRSDFSLPSSPPPPSSSAARPSALAAAAPSSASLDSNWCFQDGSRQYCFDVTGTVQYLDTKVGSSVNIHEITRTTVYESGQFVGDSITADANTMTATMAASQSARISCPSSAMSRTCSHRTDRPRSQSLRRGRSRNVTPNMTPVRTRLHPPPDDVL